VVLTEGEMMEVLSLCVPKILPFEIRTHVDECEVTFSLDVYVKNKVDISFIRDGKRWRVAGGYYCKQHLVAQHLFGTGGDIFKWWDLSEDARSFMLHHVKCLTEILDEIISSYYLGWVTQRKNAEQKFRDQYICRPKTEPNPSPYAFAEFSSSSLYLMRHSNGLTKIGKSFNPQAREKTLQAEDPRLEIVFVAESKGGYEKYLHSIFADLRKRGEWFDLDDHHVEWIKFFFCGFSA
jgi:hypothetical protein